MMGWAKYHTDDFEQAFSYFEHSLQLRKETLSDDNVLIAWAYFNSASVLTKMKETEKAIQYYEEAIRRFLRINEIGICVPAYICIAEAYLDLNDCTKATNAWSRLLLMNMNIMVKKIAGNTGFMISNLRFWKSRVKTMKLPNTGAGLKKNIRNIFKVAKHNFHVAI